MIASAFIPNKIPQIIKWLFPKYTWDIPSTAKKTIYLTFDDGPTPSVTEFILDILNKYEAKATFFCIGVNIKKHEALFNRILNEEHVIGNHTMNHIKAWQTNVDDYIRNILACQSAIDKHTSKNKQLLFRPPYGQISRSKFKKLLGLGYKIILWDVLSKDWEKKIAPKTCYENVIKNANSGSIIVFHDSIKASENLKQTLPMVLEHYTKKGFVFEGITF